MRLKNEETCQSSVTYHSKNDQFQTRRAPACLPPLERDSEDFPETDQNHLLETEEDALILDEVQAITSDY